MAAPLRLRLVHAPASALGRRPPLPAGSMSDHPGMDDDGVVHLWPGEDVAIGRSAMCAIAVDAPLAGHRHCMIRVSPEGIAELWVSGHSETSPRLNGAFVRDAVLSPGDRLELFTEPDASERVAAFVVEEDFDRPARPPRSDPPPSTPYRDPPAPIELSIDAVSPDRALALAIGWRGEIVVRLGARQRRAHASAELVAAVARAVRPERFRAFPAGLGEGPLEARVRWHGASIVVRSYFHDQEPLAEWPGLGREGAAILGPLVAVAELALRGMPEDEVSALIASLPRAPTPIATAGPFGRLLVRYNVTTPASTAVERGAFLKVWSSGKVELRERASDGDDGEGSVVDPVDVGPERAAAIARALREADLLPVAAEGYVHRFELWDGATTPTRSMARFDAARGMATTAGMSPGVRWLLEELGSLFADAIASRARRSR